MKFIPVILGTASTDTQFFTHDISSLTSQLIKGKSSDLQKILRYSSIIDNSTFALVDLHLLRLVARVILEFFLLPSFYI